MLICQLVNMITYQSIGQIHDLILFYALYILEFFMSNFFFKLKHDKTAWIHKLHQDKMSKTDTIHEQHSSRDSFIRII